MRILHIINSTKPEGGGPIESILQAHRVLAPQGHEFEIACVDEPDAPWLAEAAVKTHALGPPSERYRYSPEYLPWLRNNLGRFDCAVVHGIWLYPSYAAWIASGVVGKPYFIYTHGLLDPTFKRVFPLKHLKKTISWKLREHKVVRDAAAVFFTCEEEKRLASQAFSPFVCTPEIVPYCVGEPPDEQERQTSAFLERFPECRGKRTILFLSRIHKKKGCDLLIKAFATVASRHDDLHLVMAGPDSMGWQSELQGEAARLGLQGRITWTGMISSDLKWGAFRTADAFILPTHQENFGIAIVEALGCGTPVLITNRVNIWREIEADKAGLVAGDDEAGARHLLTEWMALPPEERDAFRDRARRCFTTRFRSEEAGQVLLKVISRSLREPPLP